MNRFHQTNQTYTYQLTISTTTPTYKIIHQTLEEATSKQNLLTNSQTLFHTLKTQYPNSILQYSIEAL